MFKDLNQIQKFDIEQLLMKYRYDLRVKIEAAIEINADRLIKKIWLTDIESIESILISLNPEWQYTKEMQERNIKKFIEHRNKELEGLFD